MQITRRMVCIGGALAGCAATCRGALAAGGADEFPSGADVQKILRERIDAVAGPAAGAGIAAGLVSPQGRRVIAQGDLGAAHPIGGRTIFEIGSVTKAFTALLLAEMVSKREVTLDDPVEKYLPGLRVPERKGRAITFVDLATHTSALPFMPIVDADRAAKFTRADLEHYVATYALPYDIGATWEYSNLGYWLLGEALAARAGGDFKNVLRARIIAPLKLTRTDFDVPTAVRADFAVGHDAALQPSPSLSSLPFYALMPAAGGLYSTVDDLAVLMASAMGYTRSPLADAFALSLSTRRPLSNPANAQALGWTILGVGKDELVLRDGGTFGYASCVAFDPAKRVGVAVLANHVAGVADIARHLLRPDFPLEKPSVAKRVEIKVAGAVLDGYVGRYEAAGEGVFIIAREGDFITIEAPGEWGLPKLRLRPETTVDFFATELPLRVTFEKDAAGHVTGMLIYPPRGQKAVPATRLA